jgi:hypothetical protein
MKTFKVIAVSLLVLPIMAFGQATTPATTPAMTLPNPGLVPSSPFYFLDRVGEALQEFFTFNSESKARLGLELAAERISEIKVMLSAKGVTAPGIEVAKARLTENLAKASAAVKKAKDSGSDVADIANEVSHGITSRKLALIGVFNDEDKDLSDKEKSLKDQLSEADKAGDVEKVKGFEKDLDAVSKEREALKKHEDESSQEFDREDDNVDSSLELKDQAQNAIDDANKAWGELMVAIPAITAADLELANKAIISAGELFAKGNYQAAKELAHQGEKALERAREMFGKKAEADRESAKKTEEINSEAAKKLEEINRENEKKQLELNNEIEKFSDELDKATSTED